LSKKHRERRIEVCTKWVFKPDSFWDEVIFSDECKFNLFNADGNAKIWREPGKRLDSKYVNSTVKHGGGGLMAWGCFSSKGIGKLVLIDGIMDKHVYCNILANNLAESASLMGLENFIFQHDNDPKHSSVIVRRFLEESGIKVLDWASQSPDLNPIEHLWAHMKKELNSKHFKNVDELKEALKSIWKEIPKELLVKLIGSMPKRIKEVLMANGGHTKY
jgi:hypothetical protein